ncbi:zinc finger CCCH domain-containing protein 2 [Dendrobium catenatum]|uniref:Zinc finger CCCH domain-containing protein 2 n=1 Tax=Dendrobium catenatum TaxID=906689 RepID=A0A2I0X2J8_9ASPA|nr:zinc finger CCCH domain-containing protein 2 [Dendrobium catenatum]PKU82144.1 Zinc finger CCCH domain-containing protein 2 [Dendrobium catenatum]
MEEILRKPTVEVPSWSPFDDHLNGMELHLPVSGISGEYLLTEAALAELQCYLPLNEVMAEADEMEELTDLPVDKYSSDEFRMYEFKIRRCTRSRSHDWTECPYAHPGEKARRRDPRNHQYSGVACPDFRKGNCKKGDTCEFAHGVFECWLHPARYRTQHCKDGTACRRRVCFFAHTPEQLRVLPIQLQQISRAIDSYDGSPQRNQTLDAYFPKGVIPSSPTSTLISPPMSSPASSPPVSPSGVRIRRATWQMGSAVNEVIASLGKLHLRKIGGGLSASVVGFRPMFCSLPSSPPPAATAAVGRGWLDVERVREKDEVVAWVESGRPLRAKMYERMSKESGLTRPETGPTLASDPDFGWVSELIK